MFRRILFYLVLLQSVFEIAPNELEKLYDSSEPDRQWPPLQSSFSEDEYTDWPGQNKPFGKVWPRIKVEQLKEPPSFSNFDVDFIGQKRPVVINGLLEEMQRDKPTFYLDKDHVIKSSRAALSVYRTLDLERPEVELKSFGDFLTSKIDGTGNSSYLHAPLHRNFKTQLRFPSSLKCSDIVEALVDTVHIYVDRSLAMPITQELNHQLFCQIEGEREVLLIDQINDFPEWHEMRLIDDKVHGFVLPQLALQMLDFSTNPLLRMIKRFHIARLRPGECLYVPAGWIQQTNVHTLDHSLEIRWKPHSDGTAQCEGRLSAMLTLGDVAWPGEGIVERPLEKTTDSSRNAFDFMTSVADKTMKSDQNYDEQKFVQFVKTDPFIVSDLIKWTDECDGVARKLFDILDKNRDAILNGEDLIDLHKVNVDLWAGWVMDMHHDFQEIGYDQKVDKFGPPNKNKFNVPIEEIVAAEQFLELEALGIKNPVWSKGDNSETTTENQKVKDEL